METMVLMQELRELLGADRVVTEPEILRRRALDTWPLRLVQQVAGAQIVPPLCVLRPQSTQEVARAVAYLGSNGIPIVPVGGGSGVTGGAQPSAGSVVIDVSEMSGILALDEENLTVTVGAGLFLGQLESWLNERGYITGHYPQSIDVAQMGGLVATRSAGQFSTRYGNIEDLLVGLEAVLPSGDVVRIGNLPRRSVGPDLRHIWLGSEGVFGIITEVTVKIFPKPVDRWMQAYGVASFREGLEIIRQVMRDGWRPALVRLHDPTEADRGYHEFVARGESILLVLSEGQEGYAQLEGRAIDQICRKGGLRPLGEEPVRNWLVHRNDVSAFERFIQMGIIVDTAEVAGPWTAIAGIYDQVINRLTQEVPEVLVVSGHSSHSYPQGTNLYFIIGAQPPRDPAQVERVYWAIWSRIMEVTLQKGGTICHHHGIGKLRAPWVPAELGTAYDLLKLMKEGLDPRGVMNPGTLLPSPDQKPAQP